MGGLKQGVKEGHSEKTGIWDQEEKSDRQPGHRGTLGVKPASQQGHEAPVP